MTAKLIQLTSPGVPDVYQGSELWELALVEPDNRRPVNSDLRRRHLAAMDGGSLPPIGDDGAAKLLVTGRALRRRRDRPDLFTRYRPLSATGPCAAHCIAFDRGGAITVATRLSHRLHEGGGWHDTAITLPHASLIDTITGRPYTGGVQPLSELFRRYPVALLTPAE